MHPGIPPPRPVERVLDQRSADAAARDSLDTTKFALLMCDPGPDWLGPQVAAPRTSSPSTATVVRHGAGASHLPRACSSVMSGS